MNLLSKHLSPSLPNKKFFFGQQCLLLVFVLCATAVWNVQASTWQVLDRVVLPADTRIAGLTVGGLSGAAWDAKTGSSANGVGLRGNAYRLAHKTTNQFDGGCAPPNPALFATGAFGGT